MTDSDLLDRAVARGAALLDERMPGWAARIDLDRLELDDTDRCILGQLFPESVRIPRWQAHRAASLDAYADAHVTVGCSSRDEWLRHGATLVCRAAFHLGQHVLGLSSADTGVYGFDVIDDDDDYPHLEDAWRAEIVRRQPTT